MRHMFMTLAIAVSAGFASTVPAHGQEAPAVPLSAAGAAPFFDACGTGSAFALQPRQCEIPDYPTPQNIQSVGLSWCRSNVGFQRRAIALQAAARGASCSTARRTWPRIAS